jgi:hypothetical protein
MPGFRLILTGAAGLVTAALFVGTASQRELHHILSG